MQLKNKTYPLVPKLRKLRIGKTENIQFFKVYRAFRGSVKCSQNMQEGAFSRSRGTDNPEHFPFFEYEINAF